MAIGDGGNDLPLLKSAGLGIAMGNAVPEVSLQDAWVIAMLCKPDVNISTPLADLLSSVCISRPTSFVFETAALTFRAVFVVNARSVSVCRCSQQLMLLLLTTTMMALQRLLSGSFCEM